MLSNFTRLKDSMGRIVSKSLRDQKVRERSTCDFCWRRKIKCVRSTGNETCAQCQRKHIQCVISVDDTTISGEVSISRSSATILDTSQSINSIAETSQQLLFVRCRPSIQKHEERYFGPGSVHSMLKALTFVPWQESTKDISSVLIPCEPDLRRFPPTELFNLCSSMFFSSQERSYYASESQVKATIHQMTRGVVDVDNFRMTCFVCAIGTAYLRNDQPIESAGYKRRELARGLVDISMRLEKHASPISVNMVRTVMLLTVYDYLNGDIDSAWIQVHRAFALMSAIGGNNHSDDLDKVSLNIAIRSLASRTASMTGRAHTFTSHKITGTNSYPIFEQIALTIELTEKIDTDILQNPNPDLDTVKELETSLQRLRSTNLDKYPLYEEMAHLHLMRAKMHAVLLDKSYSSQVNFTSALGDLLLHLETLQQQSQRSNETLYRNRPNLSYIVFQAIMTIWVQCLGHQEPSTLSDQLQVMKSRYLEFSTRLHHSSPLCRTSAAVYVAMQQLESKAISHLNPNLELPILGPIGKQAGLDAPVLDDSELWAFLASME